jgi:hypothetical protein
LGSSMSASSPSSPVGSGASLYFSQNKWCQSLRKYLLLTARDIINAMYMKHNWIAYNHLNFLLFITNSLSKSATTEPY